MSLQKKFEVDLHGHTTLSDGQDTPEEFIDRAIQKGLKVMAMTDHDVTPLETIQIDKKSIDIREYAYSKGLEIVLGSEISCDTDNEDVHLLLFGCNWQDKRFKQLVEDVSKSKIESYRKLVEILTSEGFSLDWDEMLENYGNPIAEKDIQKKLIFNMLHEKGYFPSWKEAKLMTQTNPKMDIKRKKPNPIDVIQLAHDTGGIVIDAHPFLIRHNPDELFEYLEALIEAGLDGIEARYTYDKANYKGTRSNVELEAIIRDKYGSRGLFLSGGSDYHGEWRKGVANARDMGDAGLYLDEYKGSIVAKSIHSKFL